MKKLISFLFITFCLYSTSSCQSKQSKTFHSGHSKRIQKIDSLFKSNFQQNLFHGGIMITCNGTSIYENYLGIADRKWNLPITKNTKFDIASLNKSMIAALVLKAVEKGKLHLNDKLINILSNTTLEGSFHPQITLHNLLCHSSGIADYDGIAQELKNNNFLKFKRLHFSNKEYINFISKIAPVNEPNKQFYYSNFAYHLITIILEETYAKPFSEILREKLTLPLGLTHTLSESENKKVIPKLAEAYSFEKKMNQWHQNPFIDLSLGRRIFSTVSDLNKWGQAMNNSDYLNKHSLSLMKQNHIANISKHVSYSYGWIVIDENNKSELGNLAIDKPYIIHGGSTDVYKTMLININNGAYVISFFSNVGNQTNEMRLAQQIVKFLIP